MRALVLTALALSSVALARPPAGGDAPAAAHFADDIPAMRRGAIELRLRDNQAQLRSAGLLTPADSAPLALSWPLHAMPDYPYFDYWGISNFVDHDPAFPDHVQDYSCGSRSYDTAQGYNHAGTDYFLWPAPWRTMDREQVAIVAAAPGTIVGRSDGHYDRSCAMGNSDWNAVYVRHADGTVAWYGHMKNGSLTPKGLGDTVERGEFLGFVGSSGSSTGPHLHFELHNMAGKVIDPRHGPCSGGPDYWSPLQPYEDPRINSLSVLAAAPDMIECGVSQGLAVEETLDDTDALLPGAVVYVVATYRDQRVNQSTRLRVLAPDGSVFDSWNFDLSEGGLGEPYYAATYWYWTLPLPVGAPAGVWHLEADYQGRTATQEFYVGDAATARRLRTQRERAATGSLAPAR